METVLIILGILVALIIYAFVIRPFLIHYYSGIQASAWLEIFKKEKKTEKKTETSEN